MSKKQAVAYLRASTKKQDASIPDQRNAITQYAKEHGYKIINEYVDDGISGDDTEKRLGFLKMREDAPTSSFKWIICWDQNRFGRFDSLDAGYYIKPIRDAGVQLVTLNEGLLDWNEDFGRVMYALKQEAAHDHGVKLSKDVLRGQREAAKKGSWIGSPPYAYKIEGESKAKRLILGDEAKVEIVKRIFSEYVHDGRSMSAIAKGLTNEGIISPGGYDYWRYDRIREILNNPAYVGTFVYNRFSSSKYHTLRNGEITKGGRRGKNPETDWVIMPGNHEAIVDQITFDKAQKILAKGKTGRSRYKPDNNPYLFTGLLRCGKCGSTLHGFTGGSGNRYYECSKRIYTRDMKGQEECEGTTIREDKVIETLVDYIESRILGLDEEVVHTMQLAKRRKLTRKDLPDAFEQLKRMFLGSNNSKQKPSNLKKKIDKLSAQIQKAEGNLILLEPDFIPNAQKQIREWRDQREILQRELSHQPTEKDLNDLVLEVLRKVIRLGALGAESSPNDIRDVLKEIDSIIIHTRLTGVKSSRRHHFKRGDVRFNEVGVATGKVNPQHLWF